jgi:hypothetical protein
MKINTRAIYINLRCSIEIKIKKTKSLNMILGDLLKILKSNMYIDIFILIYFILFKYQESGMINKHSLLDNKRMEISYSHASSLYHRNKNYDI